MLTANIRKPLWECKLYGTNAVIITYFEGDKVPSLIVRLFSRITKGSKWRKL